MDLKALLPPSHIVAALLPDERRGVLRQLAAPLVNENIVTDLDRFLDDLEQREQQMTTQISAGVALPHARSNAVRRLGLTVGLTQPADAGITYDPGAPGPCRVFFLIAVPAFAPAAHLPVLQALANFAHDHERIEKLLNAPSAAKAARMIVAFKG